MAVPKMHERGVGKLGRHVITCSHHVSHWLAAQFPKSIGTIFVVGYPKSGTVWATQMVADSLGMAFADMSFFPIGFPSVMHGHCPVRAGGPRNVYVVRDGRDTMVSMYFYMLRDIPGRKVENIPGRFKQYFEGVTDLEDIRGNLPGFIQAQCRRPLGTKLSWAEHVSSVQSSGRSDVPVLRYEDMLGDCQRVLGDAIAHLTGARPDENRLAETVGRFSFANQAGRKPGTEDQASFLRKGKAGDWRNHFSREAAEVFDRLCGDALLVHGYEQDRSWVDSVDA